MEIMLFTAASPKKGIRCPFQIKHECLRFLVRHKYVHYSVWRASYDARRDGSAVVKAAFAISKALGW